MSSNRLFVVIFIGTLLARNSWLRLEDLIGAGQRGFNLVYDGGGVLCAPPPILYLFFYSKSLPQTKP